jgi:hypothetical protein
MQVHSGKNDKTTIFSEHKEGMQGGYWWIEIKCTLHLKFLNDAINHFQ